MARESTQANQGSQQRQRSHTQSTHDDQQKRTAGQRTNATHKGAQSSSASTASTATSTDRPREIRTQREEGGSMVRPGSGITPRRGGALVQGPGTSPFATSPFALMQRMAADMDRLFEQFGFGRADFGLSPAFGSFFDDASTSFTPTLSRAAKTLWSPQVEVTRRGDQVVVRADLPGLDRDDLRVEIDNGMLSISGERREEEEEDREGFYRSERSYGRFHRVIALPEGVNADECKATYKDGVLEVTVSAPKEEERRSKRIQIR